MFVLNLKAYPSVLGERAVALAQRLDAAGHDAGVAVAIAPALPDLGSVARSVRIPVLAQHVDPIDAGPRTGFVPAESIAAAGARGSLVNHSEHPLADAEAALAIARLAALGLAAVVCAPDADRSARLARFRPPYIAVEPPELIGGRVAVSTARPELVASTVREVGAVAPEIAVLCGAGVHTRADVERALELGARGVLVASAVTRADRPEAVLRDLLAGF